MVGRGVGVDFGGGEKEYNCIRSDLRIVDGLGGACA